MSKHPTFTLPTGGIFEADVPTGHIASVITYLRRERLPLEPLSCPAGFQADWTTRPDASSYRKMFRAVGGQWLWFSQLIASDAQVDERVHCATTDFCTMSDGNQMIGYIETARLANGEVNITFLGLIAGYEGHGLGAYLMETGLHRARAQGAEYATVHTCTLDHPRALGFYKNCGFKPVRRAVEIAPDPRATGLLPKDIRPGDTAL